MFVFINEINHAITFSFILKLWLFEECNLHIKVLGCFNVLLDQSTNSGISCFPAYGVSINYCFMDSVYSKS